MRCDAVQFLQWSCQQVQRMRVDLETATHDEVRAWSSVAELSDV